MTVSCGMFGRSRAVRRTILTRPPVIRRHRRRAHIEYTKPPSHHIPMHIYYRRVIQSRHQPSQYNTHITRRHVRPFSSKPLSLFSLTSNKRHDYATNTWPFKNYTNTLLRVDARVVSHRHHQSLRFRRQLPPRVRRRPIHLPPSPPPHLRPSPDQRRANIIAHSRNRCRSIRSITLRRRRRNRRQYRPRHARLQLHPSSSHCRTRVSR